MAGDVECRITVTLSLDQTHWRRHDRAFWAQVLASAVDEAAPHLAQVTSYEMQDTVVHVHVLAKRPPKQMKKLLREDERFARLRSRLFDLGGNAEFFVEDPEP